MGRRDEPGDRAQLVHRGAFLEWVRHDVALPNGRRASLDVVHHPGASAVVPFVAPDRVLLLRQYRFAAGGTLWEVPAGKLEGDEPPETCAARELEEEAGVRAGRWIPLGAIWPSPGFTDERIHLFAAFDLAPTRQRLEHDEVIETVEMPLDEALALVWSGELGDAKSALALLRAAHAIGHLG